MRLKTDIKPLSTQDVMKKLAQINTYSFRMKDDPKGQIEFGVMAQELEKVFPELVKTAKDEMGTKSVNYMGLIAPLITASKELQSENASLRAELAEMKTAQADMHKDINGLKARTGYGVEKAGYDSWIMLLAAMLFGASATFFITGARRRRKE